MISVQLAGACQRVVRSLALAPVLAAANIKLCMMHIQKPLAELADILDLLLTSESLLAATSRGGVLTNKALVLLSGHQLSVTQLSIIISTLILP